MKQSQKLAVDDVVSVNFSRMSPQSRYVHERNLQSHHLRILQASFVNEVFRQHAVAGEVTTPPAYSVLFSPRDRRGDGSIG